MTIRNGQRQRRNASDASAEPRGLVPRPVPPGSPRRGRASAWTNNALRSRFSFGSELMLIPNDSSPPSMTPANRRFTVSGAIAPADAGAGGCCRCLAITRRDRSRVTLAKIAGRFTTKRIAPASCCACMGWRQDVAPRANSAELTALARGRPDAAAGPSECARDARHRHSSTQWARIQ